MDLYNHGGLISFSIAGPGVLYETLTSNDAGSRLSAPHADSIVITFDDTKRQAYYYFKKEGQKKSKPVVDKHIMDDQSYVPESNERYVFTFTEEDYEKAQ
jgi:hypothetical protein